MISYQQLMKNEQYIFKVSGMHKNNAHIVRDAIKSKQTIPDEFKKIKTNIETLIPNFSVGVVFCSVMKDFIVDTNLDEDVITVFLTDVTDIDSKLMTFIRKDKKEVDYSDNSPIWTSLYRVDLTF
eukprot:gene456-6867_t